VSDEAAKYDQLLADTVALVDTFHVGMAEDKVSEKREDLLFAVLDCLAVLRRLNLDSIGTDFGEGHTAGQLYLARRILVKIKKELA
jgi:hypothetical protein